MLRVKFIQTRVASYDGVHPMTYEAGKIYTPNSGYEGKVLEKMIERGYAELYVDHPVKSTKVTPPVQAKRGRKPKK